MCVEDGILKFRQLVKKLWDVVLIEFMNVGDK